MKKYKNIIIIQFINKFNGVSNAIPKLIESKISKYINFYFIKVNIQSPFNFYINYITILFLVIKNILLLKKTLFFLPRSNSRLLNASMKFFSIDFYTFSDGLGDSVYNYSRFLSKRYKGHYSNKILYSKTKYNVPLKLYVEDWCSRFSFSIQGYSLIILKLPNIRNFSSETAILEYQKILNK